MPTWSISLIVKTFTSSSPQQRASPASSDRTPTSASCRRSIAGSGQASWRTRRRPGRARPPAPSRARCRWARSPACSRSPCASTQTTPARAVHGCHTDERARARPSGRRRGQGGNLPARVASLTSFATWSHNSRIVGEIARVLGSTQQRLGDRCVDVAVIVRSRIPSFSARCSARPAYRIADGPMSMDALRVDYLREHIGAVLDAIHRGVDVRGCMAWSAGRSSNGRSVTRSGLASSMSTSQVRPVRRRTAPTSMRKLSPATRIYSPPNWRPRARRPRSSGAKPARDR